MNAPTLIVGLGGKGSDIVLRVSEMVTEDQRNNISFVVFDTDVNELRQIKQNNPFVRTIQTSTKLSVGEYLDIDNHSRDTWFPVNAILNSKQLTEGAGQVRAISRLAFETAVKAGKMEELHEAIKDLYKLEGNQYEQALRVIIVSSLAGGTGSGLILPVALYIKNYLATHFRQSSNITRGFFILPEVFYEVIKGQAERNNLKSNAYATLKELDAFLMKGDNTLPEKYNNTVKVEFPCVTTNGFEEYNVRPFDYCFLFDAQNVSGTKLESFEDYLDHAANCIYAQSIGPMNKRSNSSEDNTIRKLAEESGRNRYAGAGTSMLVFPNEDLKEYLALRWTQDCVSSEWLKYDKSFKERQKANAQMRRQGIRVAELKPDRFYIDTIEQEARDNDYFAKAIVDSTIRYEEDGYTKAANKWDDYLEALFDKIESENKQGNEILDDKRTRVYKELDNLKNSSNSLSSKDTRKLWNAFADAYKNLRVYYGMINKYANDSSGTIAYTIFKAQNEGVTKDISKHKLEYHLRNSESQKYMHPTAIRYFLYKTLETIKTEKTKINYDYDQLQDFFKSFESNVFDDKDTDEVVETYNDLEKTKEVTIMDKIRHRLSTDQEELIGKYNEYLEKCDEFRVKSILLPVLEEGIKYIDGLCTSFHKFYTTLEVNTDDVTKRIVSLEKKYQQTKGYPKRYVCSSKKCMQAIAEDRPYGGSFINIDNQLAEDIYSLVRNYSMLPANTDTTDYFKNIFDKGIVAYFKDSVNEINSDLINCDIIDAIEHEAKYELGLSDRTKVQQYVVNVIDETKLLAAPFIEKPIGEEKQPINSCAFNNKLNPKDDSPKDHIIKHNLKDFGGVEDEDIPLNQIIFYKSFYGLRANDLSKFAPPKRAETFNRSAGEYYKAYFELVGQIHPESHRSKVITPHIDRWWHAVNLMPDLDDNHQIEMEEKIYSAFFWALLHRYIDMFETSYDKKVYRLLNDPLGMKDEESRLVVSNSTPCDKLYEVLDALSIYPLLVNKVLNKVEEIVTEEVEANVRVDNSSLIKNLNDFRIKEYPSKDNASRSIFILPLLMKKSVVKGQYFESNAIKIINVAIKEISNYLENFYSDKELPKEVGKIVIEQYELFLKDIEFESEEWFDIYHDYLFTRTCEIIAQELDHLGLRNEAAEVRQKCKELSR